jgi:glutamate synthase (NADPH/NADH) large chain
MKDQCKQKGLYVPQAESDACGVGFIANIQGSKSNTIISDGLTMLERMNHRGACGCEENTGDGAGITIQMPDELIRSAATVKNISLPDFGEYGVFMVFFPKDQTKANEAHAIFQEMILDLGFIEIFRRKVPTDNSAIGDSALSTEPIIYQIIVKPKNAEISPKELEKELFIARKYIHHHIGVSHPDLGDEFYIVSASYKTMIYKGQLMGVQLRSYFPDLSDPKTKSALAMVHARFSTNTVPKWKLAQPFRYVAHNGEINTIQGNINAWKAREGGFKSEVLSEEEIRKIHPVIGGNLSDSACFDNVFEYLVMNGRSLPRVMTMMIPEAWHHNEQMPEFKKSYYAYNENLMEPWDGPAAICYTDGIVIGATLDRNGLRPLRFCHTTDNRIIVASEAGVIHVEASRIKQNGRLQPGKMLLVNLDEHNLVQDTELKEVICNRKPYGKWLARKSTTIEKLKQKECKQFIETSIDDLQTLQKVYGYAKEDVEEILRATVEGGKEPVASMGTDIPLAVLSHRSQHISNYFKQLFAQVTNPPIDPIRERKVMSLHTKLGKTYSPLKENAKAATSIRLKQPILNEKSFRKICSLDEENYSVGFIRSTFNPTLGDTLKGKLITIKNEAEKLVRSGANILIISDQATKGTDIPIPSLLATGAIHHHLIQTTLRAETSMVIAGGDLIDSHQIATLFGYGADAVFPWLALKSIEMEVINLIDNSTISKQDVTKRYIKGIGLGLLKIISKMGISTLAGYRGAQQFEALGLNQEVVDMCFKGTISRIEGVDFQGLENECIQKHEKAYTDLALEIMGLQNSGKHQWKRDGEKHLFNPKTIHFLQQAVRKNDSSLYEKYASEINDQTIQSVTLRGQLEFKENQAIPLEEVEPVETILKRFATGAMSFGSLSYEAHSNLAIAMNRIGAKSNSGEGGEDTNRYALNKNGDSESSAIKQVASGRFGVTIQYLSEARELQIKMAQGAKPGEGGQLPGHKVDEWIARVRNSTPGITLVSPPPHHDIYSIEDLAQLIFDLKNANPSARINVKLVSKAGVGVIASGVAKAKADAILISGHDGGTGASPMGSIHHAGLPWELGLAETHQTLIKNGLRDRIVLQTDGQLRTGRDLAIATILGAEEWGIATAALVAEGCIMMRKCHMNTCPVGVATQDAELRKRFNADPEHVINFFHFLAQDLRIIMASLGIRTIHELVGRVDLLRQKKTNGHWKYQKLDLSPILHKEKSKYKVGTHHQKVQDHGIDKVLDRKIINHAQSAIDNNQSIAGVFPIQNTDRAVGTMFSHVLYKALNNKVHKENQFSYRFTGSAGQSFGAFLGMGIEFTLEGEANDYCGKGLSGGRLIIVPPNDAQFQADKNIIIGNVAFYGATSGEAFIKGRAGERFCVRNSGVDAVVEGVGDYACEYMTGGKVVVIGSTGQYFGTGMSGGIAFIFDPEDRFLKNYNRESIDLLPINKLYENEIRQMIRSHFMLTSSKKALYILQDWKRLKRKFVVAMAKELNALLKKKQVIKETITV